MSGTRTDIVQVSIKKIKPEWNEHHDSRREHHVLCEIKKRPHPNLIEMIVAFSHASIVQSNRIIQHNFMFSRAMGNLRQLFGGELNLNMIARHPAQQDLWFQIPALTNALDHLHSNLRLAHTRLRASNILLFLSPADGSVVAKISGFESSLDLESPDNHCYGAMDDFSKPTWHIQSDFSMPIGHRDRKKDVRALGCVFAELTTFLVLGVKGVREFRDLRTTHELGLTSDAFWPLSSGNRADVKQEVRVWLNKLKLLELRAAEIVHIVLDMLNPEQQRPLAHEVRSKFEMVSICCDLCQNSY